MEVELGKCLNEYTIHTKAEVWMEIEILKLALCL